MKKARSRYRPHPREHRPASAAEAQALIDLERGNARVLDEMRFLSLRLNVLARLSVVTAQALDAAHARESTRLLNKLLDAENPGPKKRARKSKHARQRVNVQ